MKKRASKKHERLRMTVQVVMLGLITLISLNNILYQSNISSISPVSLQGICPVGGVTALYALIFAGTLISFATIAVLVSSFLFGSVFCGWICPLGTLQDMVSRLARKIRIKKYILSGANQKLKIVRYIILAVVIAFTVVFQVQYVIRELCFYNTAVEFIIANAINCSAIVFCLIIIVVSIFVDRPWCKCLCPYGALLGLTNKVRLFKLSRDASECTGCMRCEKACPMGVKISKMMNIHNASCISCMVCTTNGACGRNAITMSYRSHRFGHIRQKTVAVSLVIIMVFSFAISYITHSQANSSFDVFVTELNTAQSNELQYNDIGKVLYQNGVYEGVAVGYRPQLKLLVIIKEGVITDIQIVSHQETKGYYEEAFELIPKWIINQQSTQVDSISGATKTADGIKKAVERALRKAQN